MDKDVKISVLMPVYNAEPFLREAIDSILDQTFFDFEFIIINDGSTDKSKEIILSYNDPRIKYIENEGNIKLIATLNKGISLAKGKYIARMDADDISLPERLKTQFEFMEHNPLVGACGTWFENFGTINGITRYETSHDLIRIKMLFMSQICHPSVILRKEVLEKFNIRYNPDFIHAEDLDFFVRIAEVAEIRNIPEILFRYRQHAENISNSYKQIQLNNSSKIITEQFNKIGVNPQVYEMELFERFAYSSFDFKNSELEKLESFLKKIVYANNVSKYLPEYLFQTYIGEKWFHLNYNLARKGGNKYYNYYMKSEISSYYFPGKSALVKFYLRSLFRI